MSKQIILIGGAPTTGKSTIARLLSEHLRLPWISTDQIADAMRVLADRKKHQALFLAEEYSPEEFLSKFSAEEIVRIEWEKAEAVWPGISSFITDDHTWKEGFIIEGVDILPHLVAHDFKNTEFVKTIFLLDHDEQRTREVIYTRGLWGDANTYSDDVKEKEVEWALLFSHKIKQQADAHKFTSIDIQKNTNDLRVVLDGLNIK